MPPEKPRKLSGDELSEFENALVIDTNKSDESGEKSKDSEPENTAMSDIDSNTDGFEDSSSLNTGTNLNEPTITDTLDTTTSKLTDAMTDSVESNISQTVLSDEELKVIALLENLGFTVDRATSIPATGISVYTGKLEGYDEWDEGLIEDKVSIIINWDNQRVMVVEDLKDDLHDIYGGSQYGCL